MKHALYAGSFDPITNGHLWIVHEASRLFNHLTVAVGVNPNKQYTFSLDTRLDLLKKVIPPSPSVEVSCFHNRYLVDYAAEIGAKYIIRGIRSALDYEYEQAMRLINEDIRPEITTIFLIPPRHVAEVSSSMVKSLVGPTGWEERIKLYVPEAVFLALQQMNNAR